MSEPVIPPLSAERTLSDAELLSMGNYTRILMEREPGTLEYCASLAIAGRANEALNGLRPMMDKPQARFWAGVACWMGGEDKLAAEALATVPDLWAARLRALILKPVINVLALTHGRTGDSSHGASIFNCLGNISHFAGCNIRTEGDPPVNLPYADIHQYYGRLNPPDFFICREVEWHALPLNLQELPCPIFGHTFDFDVHIQTVAPWYGMFDELIVNTHFEGDVLRRLCKSPVSTYPRAYCASDIYELPPATGRDIDVCITGNLLHPLHPEKALLLNQLLRLSERDVNVHIEEYVDFETYRNLMNRTKLIVPFVRFGGGLATRALEAMRMGCAVAVQDTSILPLYIGEAEGLFTYSLKRGNLGDTVKLVSRNWKDIEPRIARGKDFIKREFSMACIASRYLRYLTFLAAKPRPARRTIATESLAQKRLILYLGPKQTNIFTRNMMVESLRRWQTPGGKHNKLRAELDTARELVLEYAAGVVPRAVLAFSAMEGAGSEINESAVTRAIEIYSEALQSFPDSLVLRFNLMRTILHFGAASMVREALRLGEDTLIKEDFAWTIDPMDDVFSWDFFCEMFNYRSYFNRVIENLCGDLSAIGRMRSLIRASMHYYLSFYQNQPVHAEKAARLDPDFAAYSFRHAEFLTRSGLDEDCRTAGHILLKLAENSILCSEAGALLGVLRSERRFDDPRIPELCRRAARLTPSGERSPDRGSWARPSMLKPDGASHIHGD